MNKELLQCLIKYELVDQRMLTDLAALEKMIDESMRFEWLTEVQNDLCKAKGNTLTDLGYKIYEEITE